MPLKRIMLLPSSEQPINITESTIELTLDALPPELHERAKKLLSLLSKSDVKVTSEGRVYYDWLEQCGSYLWFLIRYCLSNNRQQEEGVDQLKQPIDFDYFKQLMKQSNIPDDLLTTNGDDDESVNGEAETASDSVQWLSMYSE